MRSIIGTQQKEITKMKIKTKKINLFKDGAENIYKELSKRLPEFNIKSINKTQDVSGHPDEIRVFEISIECVQYYNEANKRKQK